MSACHNRHASQTSCNNSPQPAVCRTDNLKSTVGTIVDDLARRRVDLSEVTLDEMKRYLTAALRHCDRTAAATRASPCAPQ